MTGNAGTTQEDVQKLLNGAMMLNDWQKVLLRSVIQQLDGQNKRPLKSTKAKRSRRSSR